ncbi:LCCL domain-containing protein [Euzebya sp.]|uniref:LCCL domain-containing protein n=1 Tax=Euzebya sp. TaxID=1971409 RepID=UPI003514FE52
MRAVLLTLVLTALATGCGGADDARERDATATGPRLDPPADLTWQTTAAEYRGEIGATVTVDCPAQGEVGSLWGTDPYTDDSSICTAGVHAGAITVEDGGEVTIRIADGETSYDGGEANGVTAADWPDWPGSFTVVR